MKEPVSVFWFRRDLRLNDNAGLYQALRSGNKVLPLFIFDTDILEDLDDKDDRRVCFIYDELSRLRQELLSIGGSMLVQTGRPIEVFRQIGETYELRSVFTNQDYEPYARKRDGEISEFLEQQGIPFHSCKDQVVFEKNEILKDDGRPYTVFTPYSRKWLAKLSESSLVFSFAEKEYRNFHKGDFAFPELSEIGFRRVEYDAGMRVLDKELAGSYDRTRDRPDLEGTTRLSVHLRFGTVSPREIAREAKDLNTTLLSELIWREFFQCLLWHFPHTVNSAFKPAYDNIAWRNDEAGFEKWCKGQTGYPIVDAGMRQLEQTGWMHNRVRMITASFLCKHLLIDWRWGEAWFARKLMDYELASNVGNWQWAAGCGADAAPYFRIFNPYTQQEKFDPEYNYARRWIAEFDTPSYPAPIVDHKEARERCLRTYKKALSES